MKKLSLTDWEDKYITGPVPRFNQKNTTAKRLVWDQEFQKSLLSKYDDVSYVGKVSDKAGYTLRDQALRWSSRWGTIMELLNVSKPNPSRVSLAIMETIAASGIVRQALHYKPPREVKVDSNNPQIITRDLKKVVNFFGLHSGHN